MFYLFKEVPLLHRALVCFGIVSGATAARIPNPMVLIETLTKIVRSLY